MENNKPSETELDLVESLMQEHLSEYQKIVIVLDKRAESQGLDSHKTTSALLTTQGVIFGSLMASSLVAQMDKAKIETLNSAQLFAFMAHTQQMMLSTSQEVFFKVMKEKYGLDMGVVNKAMAEMKAEEELDGDDFGSDGDGSSGMLPC